MHSSQDAGGVVADRRGIQLTFSSVGVVANNTVRNVVEGIQFWCNWNFQVQSCHTLSFTGNYVRNASGGADIWGTVSRTTFAGIWVAFFQEWQQ